MTFDFQPSILESMELLDNCILGVFFIEVGIKIYALRLEFFRKSWNNFDLIVILISSIPALYTITIFRVLRVFKVLRIISIFPELRRMVESILQSVKAIMAVSTLLTIVMYIYAVMCCMLFGQSEGVGSQYFGNLGTSLFSLFQVMTLDSWADGMVRELMNEYGSWVAFFFAFFILSTTFTFLNMFIAVFTNTMASIDIDDGDDVGFSRIINEIKSEISELKEVLLQANGAIKNGNDDVK
jgi:voltage-gated sodium channel